MSTAKNIVETMLNKCKLKRLNKKWIRVSIRAFVCTIYWPEDDNDDIVDIARVVDCLLFYHRDVFVYPTYTFRGTETEKCLEPQVLSLLKNI